jgi:WD40 repeat protein
VGDGRRVFLSRTSEFEAPAQPYWYVAAAKEACIAERCFPVDMSDWTAADLPPAEYCRQRVSGCDVYVGIIGFRYGEPVADEPDCSYTELEFKTATDRGLTRLVFLLDEDGEMPPSGVRDPRYGDRQEAFRQRLRSDKALTVKSFRNPHELKDLISRALREPSPGTRVEPPFMAPDLPEDFVARPSELEDVVSPVRSVTAGRVTALMGGPGFGKTTLAAFACHELRDEFPGGVLWVELGEEPTEQKLIGLCADLVQCLGGEARTFNHARAAGGHLAQALGDSRVLLVLDDVWRGQDLEPFLHGGAATVRLVTTREGRVLPPGTDCIRIDQLSADQTRERLSWNLDDAGVDWSPLVRATGRWALLAGIVNATLLDDVKRGRDLAEAVAEVAGALATRGPAAMDSHDRSQRHRAVKATVELSTARLERRAGEQAARRYSDLAIFAEGVDVPLAVLAAWWGADSFEVHELARALDDLSLIQSYDAGPGTVRLHDVLRSHLRSMLSADALLARHADFLAAHRPAGGRWAELPPDALYVWRHAATHLAGAGLYDELEATVRDVSYLAAKLQRLGPPAVLDDVALLGPPGAELQGWVRRWSHLAEGLARTEDVAATLLARPDAGAFLTGAPQLPHLAYARGWACPEPSDDALDTVLGTHHRRVQAVAWSPDGTRLASTGGDGVVRVWDPGSATEPMTLARSEWMSVVAWSADGRLACGDDDGVVRVGTMGGDWLELGRHDVGVRTLAWSADGRRVASASDDGVRVWTVDGGAAPLERGGAAWVRALACSPTGTQVAWGDDDGVVWIAGDGGPRELGRLESAAFSLAWSPDGRAVAGGGDDGAIRVWALAAGGAPVELAGAAGAVQAVAWSPDGHRVAGGSEDGALRLWPATGGAAPLELGRHDGGVLAVAWAPRRSVLASGGCDGAVRLWHVEDRAGRAGVRHPRMRAVAWSPDGRRLASASADGAVRVWRADGDADPVELGRHDDEASSVAWSADARLLASGGDDGAVHVWRVDGGAPVFELRVAGDCVRTLSWSPDGPTLACAGADGVVHLWRVADGAVPQGRRGRWVRALAWSPHGGRFVTGDDDGALRVWNAGEPASAVELGRHERGVRAVAWASGGLVASGDDDGGLWLRDAKRTLSLPRHEAGVRGVAWSPTEAELISAGADGVLRLWDVAAAEVLATLALSRSLSAVAWQPGGDLLAVAGTGGLYVLEVVR